MRERLRGMLGLDAVVPVVLIAAAVLMTLDLTVLGVTISERQIVLRVLRVPRHRRACRAHGTAAPDREAPGNPGRQDRRPARGRRGAAGARLVRADGRAGRPRGA